MTLLVALGISYVMDLALSQPLRISRVEQTSTFYEQLRQVNFVAPHWTISTRITVTDSRREFEMSKTCNQLGEVINKCKSTGRMVRQMMGEVDKKQ